MVFADSQILVEVTPPLQYNIQHFCLYSVNIHLAGTEETKSGNVSCIRNLQCTT